MSQWRFEVFATGEGAMKSLLRSEIYAGSVRWSFERRFLITHFDVEGTADTLAALRTSVEDLQIAILAWSMY